MKNITLSPDQETALTRIGQWLKGPEKFFVLDGPAGCGKTELATKVAGDRRTIFTSFTGKAANVLRTRGLDASTLHRALYKPKEKDRSRLTDMVEQLTQYEARMRRGDRAITERQVGQLRAEIRAERQRVSKPSWSVPPDAAIKDAQLVVVDEYSMLDDRMVADLNANAKKVLFLGDPHQLPPVFGKCPLTGSADFSLTTVHRTALNNPILWAVTQIRETGIVPLEVRSNELGTWEPMKRGQSSWEEHYSKADQIIVAKNATRRAFNKRHRERLGRSGPIDAQDRIIFLRNDHEMEIFNGSTATVTDFLYDEHVTELSIIMDDGRETTVDIWPGILHGKEMVDAPKGAQAADYAYAITGHKSQGSEYDHVVVWDEGFGDRETYKRWAYTVASRAKRRCSFISARA